MRKRIKITVKSGRNWLGQKRWFVTIKSNVNGQVLFTGESNGYVNKGDTSYVAEVMRSEMQYAEVEVLP